MLMRERSGLSGRRRGSQKPGTAIGSAVTAAEPGGADPAGGGELGTLFVACAYAATGAKAVNIVTRAHPARRQDLCECGIPTALKLASWRPSQRRSSGPVIITDHALGALSSSARQTFCNFVDRHLDEILVHLGADRSFYGMRISWTDHSQRTRWGHNDQRFRPPGRKCFLEMLRQLREKCPFGLNVPIGLFNPAARAAARNRW